MRSDGPASFEHGDEIRALLTQELQQLQDKVQALSASRDMVASYLATLKAAEA